MQKIRVRFAPSPTGHLHIGGARAAIFDWLLARHYNGVFLVRIEDTDLQRSKQEYVDSIMESLEWLGLTPDEPMVVQSERIPEYRKEVDKLLASGAAYPCFCEPRDAEETVRNLDEGVAVRYDGTCRNKPYTEEDLKKPHAIRFKVPEGANIAFNDLIRGVISFESAVLDDFVIWRRDGMPIYNFAVVCDDIYTGITHVLRGEEHIPNTPRQILLYAALGAPVPHFAHLPLILGPSGQKLSKREGATSVVDYKKQGFLADALFNYLVRLGWSHGDQEIFSKKELIEHFSLEHVGKKGAIFDIQKLSWLNSVYIRKLGNAELIQAVNNMDPERRKNLTVVWNETKLNYLFGLYKERATTLVELVDDILMLATGPQSLDVGLINKWVTAQTKVLLETFVKRAETLEVYKHELFLSLAQEICNEHHVKLVSLAQPLRLAITGKVCSPGIFELMEVLNFEELKRRITVLVSQL